MLDIKLIIFLIMFQMFVNYCWAFLHFLLLMTLAKALMILEVELQLEVIMIVFVQLKTN